MDINPYIREASTRKHVTLVGPIAEYKNVLAQLSKEGFHVSRSGAYTDSEMFPECDPERFLIEAHKRF